METFSIKSSDIEDRIDATYYLPRNRKIVNHIVESGFEIETVGDLSERVFNPSRFTRNYVDKDIPLSEYDPNSAGKPFINPSEGRKWPEIRKIHKLGDDRQVSSYILDDPNWILITRSGTVGLTAKVNEMNGLVGSEHYLRVVFDNKRIGNYLYAFLNSHYGVPQTKRGSHGSVVEELRPENIEAISVPLLSERNITQISSLVSEGMNARLQCFNSLKNALGVFDENFSQYLPTQVSKSTFKISSTDIDDRLDAHHYLPENRRIIDSILESGFEVTTVAAESSEIYYPGWFTRRYVAEEVPFLWHNGGREGIPYLKPSKAMEIPETRRIDYVPESMEDIDEYILEKGSILVTRSGTVGVPLFVSEEFEGCAASEHLIRVVPHEADLGKYMYAFLLHRLGRTQVKRGTHGSVVKEITPTHVGDPVMPLLDEGDMQQIIDYVSEAISSRNRAGQNIRTAVELVECQLPDVI